MFDKHDLEEFIDPKSFKTYDELKTRLDAVLSGTVSVGNIADELSDEPFAEPKVDTKPVNSSEDYQSSSDVREKEEDTMAYFEKLANG